MFRAILSLGPIHLTAIVFTSLVLYYGYLRLAKDYQIRHSKAGGVRAPVLATNPFTGTLELGLSSFDLA